MDTQIENKGKQGKWAQTLGFNYLGLLGITTKLYRGNSTEYFLSIESFKIQRPKHLLEPLLIGFSSLHQQGML